MNFLRTLHLGVSRFLQGKDEPQHPDVTPLPRLSLGNTIPHSRNSTNTTPRNNTSHPAAAPPAANRRSTAINSATVSGGEARRPRSTPYLPKPAERDQETQTPKPKAERTKRKFVEDYLDGRQIHTLSMEELQEKTLSTYHERMKIHKQCLREEWEADGWLDSPVEVSESGQTESGRHIPPETKPRKAQKTWAGIEGAYQRKLTMMDEIRMEGEEEKDRKRRAALKRKQYIREFEIDAKKQRLIALRDDEHRMRVAHLPRMSDKQAIMREFGISEKDKFFGIILPTESEVGDVGTVDMTCSEEEYIPEKDQAQSAPEQITLPQASSPAGVPAQGPSDERDAPTVSRAQEFAPKKNPEVAKVKRKAESAEPHRLPSFDFNSGVKPDEKAFTQVESSNELTVEDGNVRKRPVIDKVLDSKADIVGTVKGGMPVSGQKKSDWPATVPKFGASADFPISNSVPGPELVTQPFQISQEAAKPQIANSTGFAGFKFGAGDGKPLKTINERMGEGFSHAPMPESQTLQAEPPKFNDALFSKTQQGNSSGAAGRRIARVKRKGNSSQSQGGEIASQGHFGVGGAASDMEYEANSGIARSNRDKSDTSATFPFGTQPTQPPDQHNPFKRNQSAGGPIQFGAQSAQPATTGNMFNPPGNRGNLFGAQPNPPGNGGNVFGMQPNAYNPFGGQTHFGAQPNPGPQPGQMFGANAAPLPSAANHLGNQQMVLSVPGAPQPNSFGKPPTFGGSSQSLAPPMGAGGNFGGMTSTMSFGSGGGGGAFAIGTNNSARPNTVRARRRRK